MNELCVCWLQRSRWSCMCKVRHQQQQWRPAHWLHWCLVSSRLCFVQQYSKLSWRWSLIFSIQFHCSSSKTPFTALTLLVGRQEEHPACKNWVMRCWCGYLSGARCRLFAYGPADAPSSLASFKSRLVLRFFCWLTQIVLEKRPLNRCSGVVLQKIMARLVVVGQWRNESHCEDMVKVHFWRFYADLLRGRSYVMWFISCSVSGGNRVHAIVWMSTCCR